jgi:hypothetical protein
MGIGNEESSVLLDVSRLTMDGRVNDNILHTGWLFTSAYIEERHEYVSGKDSLSDKRVSRESMITFIGLEGT